MIRYVLNKILSIKLWNIFKTILLEFIRDLSYFKCKGRICRNLKEDRSSEDVKSLPIDTEELKYKYQMGFVIPVVYTLTYAYRIIVYGFI